METEGTIHCINCQAEIRGDYCESCGQPAKPDRLSFISLWSDYFGRVFNLDTKFLRSIKYLTIDPGNVARDFVIGNRVRYIPPVSYFVILIALLLLVLALLDVSYSDIMATSQQSLSPADIDDKQLKLQQRFNVLFVENMRTFFFLQIPFVALWGKIIFRKSGYNFLENSVLAFYTHGHLVWLGMIGIFVFKFTGSAYNLANAILSAVYFSWSCAAFYREPMPKAFFKGLLVHILMTLSFMIFFIVLLIAGFVIYIKFFNPDFMNTL